MIHPMDNAKRHVHVKFVGIIGPQLDRGLPMDGRRIYTPLDIINRLGYSNVICSWQDGKVFEAIAKAIAEAHDTFLERIRPWLGDEDAAVLTEALDGPSFRLTEEQHSLVRLLANAAGSQDAFAERYREAMFQALELRIFSPIFEALETPLSAPYPGASLPEPVVVTSPVPET